MAEILGPEEGEQQEIEQVSPSALAILNQSEHAAMVQTANLGANRRKLVEFESKLTAYANHSQPIALSMFYSLPRAGKQIIGPSVRFAEIVAPCWKNCAVGSRALGASDNVVTAQGIFIDYEANLRNSVEVPRRVTDKDGRRFSDDMIVTTMNAAMSVARRNAVLKGGVPQALWTPAYEQAQLTAVGKAESHAQRVQNAMEYLLKLGVTEWQILNAVGVTSTKELETEHLLTLRVLCGEIKRGDKTIEDVFGSAFDKEIESLFGQLKMNQAQQTMLRNSYLGRAEQLVTYLRDRAKQGNTPVKQTEKPQPVETKVYSDGTSATGVAPLPDLSPAQQEEPSKAYPKIPPLGTVKDGKTITGPDGTLVQQWDPKTHIPKATDFSFGNNESDAHSWTDEEVAQLKAEGAIVEEPAPKPALEWEKLAPALTDRKPQTTMDAGQRRRGRPTREEVARRAAAAATTVPEPGQDEPEDQSDFTF